MSTAAKDEPSRLERFVANYKKDHQHPVNHFLHVGVGWPLVAAAVLLAPFRPLWSVGLVVLGYIFMFTGHFAFEKNKPTLLEHPQTPFVMAWAVVRGLASAAVGLFRPKATKASNGESSTPIL